MTENTRKTKTTMTIEDLTKEDLLDILEANLAAFGGATRIAGIDAKTGINIISIAYAGTANLHGINVEELHKKSGIAEAYLMERAVQRLENKLGKTEEGDENEVH